MSLGAPLPTKHGWGLLAPVIPLCLAGVLTIHVTAEAGGASAFGPAARQLVFIVAGVLLTAGALVVGYQRIGRLSYALFVLSIGLLGWVVFERLTGVHLPLATDRGRNAWRWIQVGPVTLQPSELMKIAYVLALAWYLRYRRNYRTLRGLVLPFMLSLVPMGLIILQPDLGTVLLFLPVLFAMLYAAGAKGKHLAAIILLGVISLPVFWLSIKSYQRLRLAGVVLQSEQLRSYLGDEGARLWVRLQPPDTTPQEWRRRLTTWANDTGYQLVRSKVAIGSGGPFGYGWGKGVFVEHPFLPERHNDFIFAVIGHQWGLVGCLTVVACYVIIVVLGFDVATLTNDPFGRLVAVGISTLLAVQGLTNLGMTIGLGPVTGVTLPFVSAGGSSLLASFLCLGLLISVAQRRPLLLANAPFEFDEEAERYGTVPG